MSFHKKPAAPALSLKQSSAYGKLPSDAIVGMDRRDLPPSLRRGTSGLNAVTNNPGGRTVPSYMQGTQTSQRKDIGLNVRRLAKSSEKQTQEVDLKGYGAPRMLPSLYEQSQQQSKTAATQGDASKPSPQQTTSPAGYTPLQIGKSREATPKELHQISKSCRYVRRKGSLIDPPSYYYKR